MATLKVAFLDAQKGTALPDTADIEVTVFKAGTVDKADVTNLQAKGHEISLDLKPGVYVMKLETREKIVSLFPDKPKDFGTIVVEASDSQESRNVYVWELDPDPNTPLPVLESESGVQAQASCSWCNERYTTRTSPYYGNYAWWHNCYYNPPCSPP